MSIKLLKLKLVNFKGIKEFVLDTDGGDVAVFGDNATGKTTLFDAFTWLLFDKDSQNKKDFEIKTLRPDGTPIHNLEHEVEGVLLIDGRQIALRKVFREKWTKKRGSATAEFSGHTTDYFLDGVPVKKNEYDDFVASIVDEGIFKLLTSPTFFNEQLKWQERRKILLEVCGDVSDADVIASNPELAGLPTILDGRTIENHRKVVLARRKAINDELEKIPIRIDEAERSKPDVSGYAEGELQERIDALKWQIEAKQAELQRIQSGGEIAEKEKLMREIEAEMLALKNEIQAVALDMVNAKRQNASTLKGEIDELNRNIRERSKTIERNNQWIAERKAEADRLRQEWHQINGEIFEPHYDTNCPACGQDLPKEQIQAAHEKALADFNRRKAERLEQITVRGKTASGETNRLETENAELAREIATLEQQLAAKGSELRAAESELSDLQSGMTDVETNPRYVAKLKEAETVKADILRLRSAAQGKIDEVRLELAKLRTDVELLEQQKARFDQVRKIDERIAELATQEKALAAEFERLEKELFLLDEFTRSKVELLESHINSKFRMARFKLFNQQVNGGLEETCEVMVDGVPYGSLNNAARINVGLDIINTLTEHYGITAPIFIDNRESVVRLIETKSQVISLIVSAADKQLRVETEKVMIKEVV